MNDKGTIFPTYDILTYDTHELKMGSLRLTLKINAKFIMYAVHTQPCIYYNTNVLGMRMMMMICYDIFFVLTLKVQNLHCPCVKNYLLFKMLTHRAPHFQTTAFASLKTFYYFFANILRYLRHFFLVWNG